MSLRRACFWSMLATVLLATVLPGPPLSALANTAPQASGLDCDPFAPWGSQPGAPRPACHAVAYVCGQLSGYPTCQGGNAAHFSFEVWDGGTIGNSASASSSVEPLPFGGMTSPEKIESNASASPGSVHAYTHAVADGTAIGAGMSAGMVVEFFSAPNTPSGLPALISLTLAFQGNATVDDPNKPSDTSGVRYAAEVFLNQIGHPRWPLSGATCQTLSNNCSAYLFTGGIDTTHYDIDEVDRYLKAPLTSNQSWPLMRGTQKVSFPQEGEFTVPPGYQPTIVMWATAQASGDATADLGDTVHLYLESKSGDAFTADSGHDYSDPAHWPTVRVKSTSVAPGNHMVEGVVTTDPDQGWKTLGGGVRMEPVSAGKFITRTEQGGAFAEMGPNAWDASGRDDLAADLGGMTVFGFQLRDGWSDASVFGDDQHVDVAHYDVQLVDAQHAQPFSLSADSVVKAHIPPGSPYVMAGGTCRIADSSLNDTLLVGSYPENDHTWVCAVQRRVGLAPQVDASVYGIRSVLPGVMQPHVLITKATSGPASSPSATAPLAGPGFVIVGCGGSVTLPIASRPRTTPPAQALTGMFPVLGQNNTAATGCQATSRDHNQSGDGTVTAYAINLLLASPALDSIAPGHLASAVKLSGTHFVDGMVLVIMSDWGLPPSIQPPHLSAIVPVSVSSSRDGTVTLPPTVAPGAYKVFLAIPNADLGSQVMIPFSVQ